MAAEGVFPRLEGPRRRNYSAPSNSMQPRGFLRMHIFMDGMRIVWRACRCSGVDATRIYSRASKRRARAIRASSLDTASPDRSPASLRACRLPLRIPSTRGFLECPERRWRDEWRRNGAGTVFDTPSCPSQLPLRHVARLFRPLSSNQFRRSTSMHAKVGEEDEEEGYF